MLHYYWTMDTQTRIELLELYFTKKSASAAIRAYNTAHQVKRDSISVSTVTRLVTRFYETGSVHDKPRSGRPSLEEERKPLIQEELVMQQNQNQFGVASSHSVARGIGIPQSSVQRILRNRLHMYPYKLQTNQQLSGADKDARIEFANLMSSGAIDLDKVLWTDESYFSLTGHVYKSNCTIWGTEKPRPSISIDVHAPKICVWFGFSACYRLTPFFFPATVTGQNYADMLDNHVFPEMRRKRKMSSTIWQQDGAPPHFSLIARASISAAFPNDRIISRGYPQKWPAHSPDLSPLDYYLWATVKSRVYFNFTPRNLQELQERISQVIADIDQEELRRAVHHLPLRLECVLENGGDTFEHMI